jgi:hypothetical protein
MNSVIRLKRTSSVFLGAFWLGCFALAPALEALSPPPDGGYPGGNTAEGQNALTSLTSGTYNTAVGFDALSDNSTALFNTAIGSDALATNNVGGGNTAAGSEALTNNTSGSSNTAVGNDALLANTTGSNNTAEGVNALDHNISGNGNVALGFGAGENVTTANNVICIGASMPGANTSNTCFIGNIFGVTSSGGANVLVNSNGKLGTVPSSRRFKDGIKPMDQASEALFALKPVTFYYKKEIDPSGISQFGLVAEDVEKVNPDLVVRDNERKPYSVRYDQVNAMLLNEFLKEHKAFVEEQHKVEKLEATVTNLMATVKGQAAQIQKVSAQLELNKPASQTVLNNQ